MYMTVGESRWGLTATDREHSCAPTRPMSIEQELWTEAASAGELKDLLTRAASEIERLRAEIGHLRVGQLNSAVSSTLGEKGPL